VEGRAASVEPVAEPADSSLLDFEALEAECIFEADADNPFALSTSDEVDVELLLGGSAAVMASLEVQVNSRTRVP
jgi:hypothetical protein